MIKKIILLSLTCLFSNTRAQTTLQFADSIRKFYHIPELAYAVVSSTQVYEMQILGITKINTERVAKADDRFRIGSNTKAITGFIAALLVKKHKIAWDTKFFDLYPELKAKSNPAYYHLTLLDLLSLRTKLFPYTYTYEEPQKEQFTGNEDEQRYQFAAWFFQQEPIKSTQALNFSNLAYAAAGLMLEKASGKSYKELVTDLGTQLNIAFDFGTPNTKDSLQPWGHDKDLNPEAPADNYKLNWLLAAGNINVSLPDYAKFIQLQLQGLLGKSNLLTKEEFSFLHYGLAKFAVGWFWIKNEDKTYYSYNIGNPGTFLSKVYVFKDLDRAYILFANVQSPEADAGLTILFNELESRYSK